MHDDLAKRFETHRRHLRAVAHRLLGSAAEAEDAVQETWLRLTRDGGHEIDNLGAWLQRVLSRICLDVLRSSRVRRELLAETVPDGADPGRTPEAQAVMADSVGRALLVVLERLPPLERVAFVLHDMFATPFDQIAPIVDRSPGTAKKLASRARQRVRGTAEVPPADLAGHRQVVSAFLAASRNGDLDSLLEVLAPDVVRRADKAALSPGVPVEVRGARTVAEETVALAGNARYAELALVDGGVGLVVAPYGHLVLALTITIAGGRVTGYEVIADPDRLDRLDLALVEAGPFAIHALV